MGVSILCFATTKYVHTSCEISPVFSSQNESTIGRCQLSLTLSMKGTGKAYSYQEKAKRPVISTIPLSRKRESGKFVVQCWNRNQEKVENNSNRYIPASQDLMFQEHRLCASISPRSPRGPDPVCIHESFTRRSGKKQGKGIDPSRVGLPRLRIYLHKILKNMCSSMRTKLCQPEIDFRVSRSYLCEIR